MCRSRNLPVLFHDVHQTCLNSAKSLRAYRLTGANRRWKAARNMASANPLGCHPAGCHTLEYTACTKHGVCELVNDSEPGGLSPCATPRQVKNPQQHSMPGRKHHNSTSTPLHYQHQHPNTPNCFALGCAAYRAPYHAPPHNAA